MKRILLVTTLLFASLSSFAGGYDVLIKGGTKAEFGRWPSTVALLDVDRIKLVETGRAVDINGDAVPVGHANYVAQFCGASLIAPDWILTAAHCLVDEKIVKSVDKVKTLIGAFDLLTDGYRRDVEKIIIHPDYDEETTDNDIALIKLKTRVNAPTIAISSVYVPNGTLAYAVGWGDLDGAATNYPSKLYEVELPVMDISICKSIFNDIGSTDIKICAGYKQGRKRAPCNGDSGGPLMARFGNGGYEQIGIVSWGIPCTNVGSYAVYTRLSGYKSWINSKMFPAKESSGGGSMLLLLLPFFLLLAMRFYRPKLVLSKIK